MILSLAFCFLDSYRSSQVHSRVPVPRSQIVGKTPKKKAREKMTRREKDSSRFIFVFALPQFSGLSRSLEQANSRGTCHSSNNL